MTIKTGNLEIILDKDKLLDVNYIHKKANEIKCSKQQIEFYHEVLNMY